MKIDVSIVIVNYRTPELTMKCLDSLARWVGGVSYEIIVVDNGSTDGSEEAIRKFKIQNSKFKIEVIRNRENLGFAGGNNLGAGKAKGRYVLLLNSDTALFEDAVSPMVNYMDENPSVGVVSCRLVNKDGSTQETGGFFPDLRRLFFWATFLDDLPGVGGLVKPYHPRGTGFYDEGRDLDWVSGAVFMVRRSLWDEMAGLDEEYFMYVEEVDFCFRLRERGYRVRYEPLVSIMHLGGGSGGGSEAQVMGEFRGLVKFYEKHFKNEVVKAKWCLRLAAVLRLVVFGFLGGQREARRAYGKVLAVL